MQKERFLEIAPGCIGVHLHGEELNLPEMEYIAKGELFTAIPRTVFFASTASVTKEKTRRVGGVNTESLCALSLVKNTLLECIEREHQDYKEHYGVAPISKQLCCCLFFGRTILKEERESTRTIRVSIQRERAIYGCALTHPIPLAFPETYTASLRNKRRDVTKHLRPVRRSHDD